MTTNKFIFKLIAKGIFIMTLMAVMVIANSLGPTITNAVAMGQMQSSDAAFALMDIYPKVVSAVRAISIIGVCFTLYTIFRDTVKFVHPSKMKKEN